MTAALLFHYRMITGLCNRQRETRGKRYVATDDDDVYRYYMATERQARVALRVLLKRKKAESEAQRGRPEGTLESGVRV